MSWVVANIHLLVVRGAPTQDASVRSTINIV